MNDNRPHTEDPEDAFLAPFYQPPRPAFTAALRDRLRQQEAAAEPSRCVWPWSSRPPRASRAWGAALAAGLLLLLSIALAAPVIARTRATLPHSEPREIPPPTAGAVPVLVVPTTGTYVPTPAGAVQQPTAGSASPAGPAPLVPTYLPPGCTRQGRSGYGDLGVTVLAYSCVIILEQSARQEHPAVGTGSTEQVSVGDLPAIYTHGAWQRGPTRGRIGGTPEAVGDDQVWWNEDLGQELVLERDGLIIRLQAGGVDIMPKDELIRIAAALQPAR